MSRAYEDARDDSVVYGWRVFCKDEVPPGLDTNGTPEMLWSAIPAAPTKLAEHDSDA